MKRIQSFLSLPLFQETPPAQWTGRRRILYWVWNYGMVLAAGLAGPVGLAAVFLVFLFALSDVAALGVPYLAPHPFPSNPLAEDGVIRRDYRRMSRQPFNIWQRRG